MTTRPITGDQILRLIKKYRVRLYPDLTGPDVEWYAGVVTCKNGINFIQLHKMSDPSEDPESAVEDLAKKMNWDVLL